MLHITTLLFVTGGALMARMFAYCRVSTPDQTVDNQIREIGAAGFAVDPKRVVTETVSGSVAAEQRKGFARLLDRLEDGGINIWRMSSAS